MRHDHQRAAPGVQVLGQPVDAGHVEMVGRLVEDQQIRGADEESRQRHPAPLATGHLPGGRLRAEVGQAETAEHGAHPGVAGPLVLGGERGG